MNTLNEKLALLQAKIKQEKPVTIMIMGLGSVGLYLFDYLVSLGDPGLHLVVTGRSREKLLSDVNIVRTAAAIRGCLKSKIDIEGNCDLEDVGSVCAVIKKYSPDFIVNSSRVYSGLKYGSISWHNLRAYGIWAPLSVRYAKNIMEAYEMAGSRAITINTSYSDAVIPWLKSVGKAFFDFGSGNLNHLIPRIRFYVAEKWGIDDLNAIDVTLAASHFHDVVISKEGHSEGQKILLDIKYQGKSLEFEQEEVFKACRILMPSDQKRNMMNASSNFDIICSVLRAIRNGEKVKVHSPGVCGEIGGYPYIIDGSNGTVTSYFDTSIFTMEEMREANRRSIYLDGIENVSDGKLYYTRELVRKVQDVFSQDLPAVVDFDSLDSTDRFLIDRIIVPNM